LAIAALNVFLLVIYYCKAIKKRRIITLVLVAILLLLIVFVVAITKSSRFQTQLIHFYLEKLSKELHTEISVGDINVNFFTGVTLNKLFVKDLHNDTLVYINKLNVDIKIFSISDKKKLRNHQNLVLK
jgi:autotransporter translocation and assembly factor TamB